MNSIFSILIIFIAMLSTACGDRFKEMESAQGQAPQEILNGKSVKVPIIDEDGKVTEEKIKTNNTISGSPDLYAQSQEFTKSYSEELNPTTDSDLVHSLDLELGDSIRDVTVTKTASNLNIQIKLKLDGKEENLNFNRALKAGTQIKSQKMLIPSSLTNAGPVYNLKMLCFAEDCLKANIILLQCTENTVGVCKLSAKNTKFASLLYTQTKAFAKVARANGQSQQSEREKKIAQLLQDGANIYKKSVVVMNGPSFSDIHIKDNNSEQSLLIHTNNIDTTETAVNASISSGSLLDMNDLSITLERNNPNTGRLVFDISSKSPGAVNKNMRIYISEEELNDNELVKQEKRVSPSPASINKLYKNAFMNPLEFSDRSRQTTIKFEKYRNTKTLNRFIRHWQGKEGLTYCGGYRKGSERKKILQEFFFHSQPLIGTTERVAEHIGITPEFLYLSPLESFYSRKAHYPVEVTRSPISTASGPFQITTTTARDIKDRLRITSYRPKIFSTKVLAVFKNSKKRELLAEDDRGFFETSALMSARYSKEKIDDFSDPAIWPLAYHLGSGAVSKIIRRILRDQKVFNENLLDIAKNTPHQNKECHMIRYSLDFLAIRFIASNPEKYGFKLKRNPKKESDVPSLFRPEHLGGQILK